MKQILPSYKQSNRLRWSRVLTRRTVASLIASLGVGCVVAGLALMMADTMVQQRVHAYSKQGREAGAVVFREKGCEHCHGADGIGSDRGPGLSGIGKRWRKDRIEQQIVKGGDGMPAFGDALQADEVKNLVEFLSAKKKAPKTSKHPSTPAPVPAHSQSDDSGV